MQISYKQTNFSSPPEPSLRGFQVGTIMITFVFEKLHEGWMTSVVEIFSYERSDGRSTAQARLEIGCVWDRIMHITKRETQDFYMETHNREKSQGGGGGEIHYNLLVTRIVCQSLSARLNWKKKRFKKSSHSLKEKVYICLTDVCAWKQMVRVWSS